MKEKISDVLLAVASINKVMEANMSPVAASHIASLAAALKPHVDAFNKARDAAQEDGDMSDVLDETVDIPDSLAISLSDFDVIKVTPAVIYGLVPFIKSDD